MMIGICVHSSSCDVWRSVFIFGFGSWAKSPDKCYRWQLPPFPRWPRLNSHWAAFLIRRCYSTTCRRLPRSCSPSWSPCRSTSALALEPTTATPSSSCLSPCIASCLIVRNSHLVSFLNLNDLPLTYGWSHKRSLASFGLMADHSCTSVWITSRDKWLCIDELW